jgi:hypothetical protein
MACLKADKCEADAHTISDDDYMAFLLGFASYFDDDVAKDILEKETPKYSGLNPHMSTDADLDALFKQIYQECLDQLADRKRKEAPQTETEEKGNNEIDSLDVIEHYFGMYFSRHYDASLWKNPKLLSWQLEEREPGEKMKYKQPDGMEKTLRESLIPPYTSSRNHLNITEIWKDDVKEVFGKNGIKWPVVVAYSERVKDIGDLKIVMKKVGNESTTVVDLKELYPEATGSGVQEGSEYLFYMFGEITDKAGRLRSGLTRKELKSLFGELCAYGAKGKFLPEKQEDAAGEVLKLIEGS